MAPSLVPIRPLPPMMTIFMSVLPLVVREFGSTLYGRRMPLDWPEDLAAALDGAWIFLGNLSKGELSRPSGARSYQVQFLFGDCVLDPDRREFSRGGEVVAMGPQVFDLLT